MSNPTLYGYVDKRDEYKDYQSWIHQNSFYRSDNVRLHLNQMADDGLEISRADEKFFLRRRGFLPKFSKLEEETSNSYRDRKRKRKAAAEEEDDTAHNFEQRQRSWSNVGNRDGDTIRSTLETKRRTLLPVVKEGGWVEAKQENIEEAKADLQARKDALKQSQEKAKEAKRLRKLQQKGLSLEDAKKRVEQAEQQQAEAEEEEDSEEWTQERWQEEIAQLSMQILEKGSVKELSQLQQWRKSALKSSKSKANNSDDATKEGAKKSAPMPAVLLPLLLVSEAQVFADLAPAYKLRGYSAEEKGKVQGAKVSKDVKNLRKWEEGLLHHYKDYVQDLNRLTAHFVNLGGIVPRTAIRCQCLLVTRIPHFNFRTSLLESLQASLQTAIVRDHSAVVEAICRSFGTFFADHTPLDDATVEAIRYCVAGVVRHVVGMYLAADGSQLNLGPLTRLSHVIKSTYGIEFPHTQAAAGLMRNGGGDKDDDPEHQKETEAEKVLKRALQKKRRGMKLKKAEKKALADAVVKKQKDRKGIISSSVEDHGSKKRAQREMIEEQVKKDLDATSAVKSEAEYRVVETQCLTDILVSYVRVLEYSRQNAKAPLCRELLLATLGGLDRLTLCVNVELSTGILQALQRLWYCTDATVAMAAIFSTLKLLGTDFGRVWSVSGLPQAVLTVVPKALVGLNELAPTTDIAVRRALVEQALSIIEQTTLTKVTTETSAPDFLARICHRLASISLSCIADVALAKAMWHLIARIVHRWPVARDRLLGDDDDDDDSPFETFDEGVILRAAGASVGSLPPGFEADQDWLVEVGWGGGRLWSMAPILRSGHMHSSDLLQVLRVLLKAPGSSTLATTALSTVSTHAVNQILSSRSIVAAYRQYVSASGPSLPTHISPTTKNTATANGSANSAGGEGKKAKKKRARQAKEFQSVQGVESAFMSEVWRKCKESHRDAL